MTPNPAPSGHDPLLPDPGEHWALRGHEPGQPDEATYGSMTRAEADQLCADLRRAGWTVVVVDLLAQARARFPIGTRVRHPSTNRTATVQRCPPHDPITKGHQVAHVLVSGDQPAIYLGAPVHSWIVAAWLEPADSADPTTSDRTSADLEEQP